MPTSVSILAPAKVNLRLKVLTQQTSGYHSLESVFCAISLADEITVRPGAGEIELSVEGGVDVGPDDENLAVRAARRFFLELGGEGEGARIELRKRIPAAAGLGGGSSDAAATLLALNALHGEPVDRARLVEIGGELGSDVPFFLCGSPLALGWGRGERLLALPPLPPRPVLVAHPGVAMPTGQAFQRIAELRGGGYNPPAFTLDSAALSSWEAIGEVAENDFEHAAAERLPTIGAAKAAMVAAGAEIALLAGSGSSVFGVFPSREAVHSAAGELGALGYATWPAETLRSFPAPNVTAA
jgi:4-diphosphocytidyl-2-C-methyl-D-erythritol kinase